MSKQSRLFGGRGLRALACALISALMLVCLALPARAQASLVTGTFTGTGTGREVAYSYKGKAQNNWAGVLNFKIDNGPTVSVFCIQITVRVRAGDRYRSDGPVLALPNGCQIRYLLDKYPASTAKDADEAAARQMAIWVYSDGVDPSTIADAKVRSRTIALVNEAKSGPCPERRTTPPELTLDPPTASAAAGQTVAYTVRAGPADAGQTLTVSVTGPAALADASGASSGQQQQNLTLDGQGQAQFWVAGTGPGPTSVRVDLPYRLEAGTVFSQLANNKPSQRLVMSEAHDLVAKASAQINWSAGAPQPSPTPAPPQTAPSPTPQTAPSPTPQTAPSPTPLETTATQQAVAPTATPAPPTPKPTRRPSNSKATPVAAEQPTETVVAGEQATAAPSPAQNENVTATPGAPLEAGGATATAQPAGGAVAPTQPAGGAAARRPRALPNTAGPTDSTIWPILLGLALLISGWLMRRRDQ